MSPSTCFFIVILTICVSFTAHGSQQQHPRLIRNQGRVQQSDVVVSKACEWSPEKAFCLSVLKANAKTPMNDMKQSTFVALEAASKEAVSTAEFIKGTIQTDEIEDSSEEQVMSDCEEAYSSIVDLLADATNALLRGPETAVEAQIMGALSTAETCKMSIKKSKSTSGKATHVGKKNENVMRFCSNALTVYLAYNHQG